MLHGEQSGTGKRAIRADACLVLVALWPGGCSDRVPELTWAPDAGPPEEQAVADAVRIRVMAGNLTSGNGMSYDSGHGIRIFQGTKPDVVLIQELNYGAGTTADVRAFVDIAFGPHFSFCREAAAQIPNGIISYYPILECGEWDDPHVSNRDFAYARIDIPGPVDLWAVSVHFLTATASARERQARSLLSHVQDSVPAGDYLIIGGDMNTKRRGEPAVRILDERVVTAGPYPADHRGNGNTNASRSKPYDWVLASAALDQLEIAVQLGASTFSAGLVVDTRMYAPIGELDPALASDSATSGMQHMGVIRDFALPGGPGSAGHGTTGDPSLHSGPGAMFPDARAGGTAP